MYLLYAGEPGSIHDPRQRFFVLTGVAVFERASHWIEQELNGIAKTFQPDDSHELELSANAMRVGKKQWRRFSMQSSRGSRFIQLADLLCDVLFRKHEYEDDMLCNNIRNCFDAEGGVQHGLCVPKQTP